MTCAGAITRLLSRLHTVFGSARAPDTVVALRIAYDGTMAYRVRDGYLTTTVTGGSGAGFELDLRGLTVAQLASNISARAGWSVSYTNAALSARSALVLLDDEGSGPDILAYQSLLWAMLHPVALALRDACLTIPEAVKQISVGDAEGEWLDEHGDYFGLRRVSGQVDADYLDAIIAYVLLARSNNLAIGNAIGKLLGLDPADIEVLDVKDPDYESGAIYPAISAFLSGAGIGGVHGEFDVISPDVLSDESGVTSVLSTIERFKAAGTRMRRLWGTAEIDGAIVFGGAPQAGQVCTLYPPEPGDLVVSGNIVIGGAIHAHSIVTLYQTQPEAEFAESLGFISALGRPVVVANFVLETPEV